MRTNIYWPIFRYQTVRLLKQTKQVRRAKNAGSEKRSKFTFVLVDTGMIKLQKSRRYNKNYDYLMTNKCGTSLPYSNTDVGVLYHPQNISISVIKLDI